MCMCSIRYTCHFKRQIDLLSGASLTCRVNTTTAPGSSGCTCILYDVLVNHVPKRPFRGGGGCVAPLLKTIRPQIGAFFLIHRVPGAKSGTVNTVVTVGCPTPLGPATYNNYCRSP